MFIFIKFDKVNMLIMINMAITAELQNTSENSEELYIYLRYRNR